MSVSNFTTTATNVYYTEGMIIENENGGESVLLQDLK